MNRKEQTRAKVITLVMERRCTAKEAAELLQLSKRHLLRLKRAYREDGPAAGSWAGQTPVVVIRHHTGERP